MATATTSDSSRIRAPSSLRPAFQAIGASFPVDSSTQRNFAFLAARARVVLQPSYALMPLCVCPLVSVLFVFRSVFGKGQGAASGAGSLKKIAAANLEQKFLHFGENRCITKSNLTLPEGTTTALWAQGGHIPGYDGYIPGHDVDFDKTFGASTVAAKLKQSKEQSAFVGADGRTVQSIPQSEVHSSRGGATGDLGGRAKLPAPSPPVAPAPAVPGYRGYIFGRQYDLPLPPRPISS